MYPQQDSEEVKKMSHYIFETKKMPLLNSVSCRRPAQCIQLIPNKDTCSIVMHHCERLSRYLAKHQSKCQVFSKVWIANFVIVTNFGMGSHNRASVNYVLKIVPIPKFVLITKSITLAFISLTIHSLSDLMFVTFCEMSFNSTFQLEVL